MSFVLCADFTIFPDNTQLGPTFPLAGMTFQDNPGGATSFVNQTSGLNGLQFPDVGIEARLPMAVQWVGMYLGQFNSSFIVEVVDSNGVVTSSTTYNKPNTYSFLNFSQANIATIRFSGGGNEGVIVSLCILIP